MATASSYLQVYRKAILDSEDGTNFSMNLRKILSLSENMKSPDIFSSNHFNLGLYLFFLEAAVVVVVVVSVCFLLDGSAASSSSSSDEWVELESEDSDSDVDWEPFDFDFDFDDIFCTCVFFGLGSLTEKKSQKRDRKKSVAPVFSHSTEWFSSCQAHLSGSDICCSMVHPRIFEMKIQSS